MVRIYLTILLFAMSNVVFAQVKTTDQKDSDEYALSHVEVDAGGLTGLVLPDRIAMIPKKSYKWEPVEKTKLSITYKDESCASVRALKSGTTVINYKYTYEVKGKETPVLKDGKPVIKDGKAQMKVEMITKEGTFPFTIKIHKISPESMVVPGQITVEWDETCDLSKFVTFNPKYSESVFSFEIKDIEIVDKVSYYNVRGKQLGETKVLFKTSEGLIAESKINVIIPSVRSVQIEGEKKMVVGEEQQLSINYSPKRATPLFGWKSSDNEIVKITNDGKITALSPGKATITVTSDNGVKGEIDIKVKKK